MFFSYSMIYSLQNQILYLFKGGTDFMNYYMFQTCNLVWSIRVKALNWLAKTYSPFYLVMSLLGLTWERWVHLTRKKTNGNGTFVNGFNDFFPLSILYIILKRDLVDVIRWMLNEICRFRLLFL